MIPAILAAICAAVAASVILSGGIVIGWGIHGLATADRCGCGHAFGCADKYTGACTATVIETSFVGGVRRTRKRVPCPCRAHRPAGMSAPGALDRDFILTERSQAS